MNIAQLRLWISLAVDFEGDKPEPLPNLDFKIEQGDSVTGPTPHDTNTDFIRAKLIGDYLAAKELYLTAHGPDKPALRDEINSLKTQIAEYTHGGIGQKRVNARPRSPPSSRVPSITETSSNALPPTPRLFMMNASRGPPASWVRLSSINSGIDMVLVVKRNIAMTSIIAIAAPTPAPNPPGIDLFFVVSIVVSLDLLYLRPERSPSECNIP
jgi:hypothetical protein